MQRFEALDCSALGLPPQSCLDNFELVGLTRLGSIFTLEHKVYELVDLRAERPAVLEEVGLTDSCLQNLV